MKNEKTDLARNRIQLMFTLGCAKKQVQQEDVVVVEETEVVVVEEEPAAEVVPPTPWKSTKVSTKLCPLPRSDQRRMPLVDR